MKKIRIQNLMQWFLLPKDKAVYYHGSTDRDVSIEVNPVGPVVLYVAPVTADNKIVKGKAVFLACVTEMAEIMFRAHGNVAVFAEGELWVRHDQTPIFTESDPELVPYTRFEKVGLYYDEIGMALHRQATLQRLQELDGSSETSIRAQRLERDLAKATRLLEELRAQVEQAPADAPEVPGDA